MSEKLVEENETKTKEKYSETKNLASFSMKQVDISLSAINYTHDCSEVVFVMRVSPGGGHVPDNTEMSSIAISPL